MNNSSNSSSSSKIINNRNELNMEKYMRIRRVAESMPINIINSPHYSYSYNTIGSSSSSSISSSLPSMGINHSNKIVNNVTTSNSYDEKTEHYYNPFEYMYKDSEISIDIEENRNNTPPSSITIIKNSNIKEEDLLVLEYELSQVKVPPLVMPRKSKSSGIFASPITPRGANITNTIDKIKNRPKFQVEIQKYDNTNTDTNTNNDNAYKESFYGYIYKFITKRVLWSVEEENNKFLVQD